MHDRSDERRAGVSLAVLGLTALVLVGAGTAAVGASAGATTQQSDEELVDGGLYFVGQQLVTDRYDAGTELTLRRGDGSFVSDLVVDDGGVLRIDTAGRDPGTYRVDAPDGSQVTFELARHELSVTATPTQVTGDDRTVQFTVDSNRDGYDLVVSSDGLDADALASRSDQLTLRDGQAVGPDAGTVETLTVDFDGVADGTYEIDVGATDTTASTTATVRVGTGSGAATFESTVVVEDVGDVGRVPVAFDDTNRATLTVGSEGLNWQVRIDVVDADGNGSAVVKVNTDNARQSGRVFSAAGADRVENVQRVAGDQFADPDRRVDPAPYPLRLSAGGTTNAATLRLENPNSVRRSVSVTTVSGVVQAGRVPDAAAVADTGGDAATSVATGDWVVLRVQAAGIFGYVDELEDLTGDGTRGVTLRLVRRSGVGSGPDVLGDESAYELVPRPERNTLLVFTKPDIGGLDVGDRYEARFRVDGSNPYVTSTVERSARLSVERPSATVDAVDDGVGVAATASSRIQGRTNLADGTELAVSVSGPDVSASAETTVQNGTWRVDVDLSEATPGQQLTLEVGRLGETITSTEAVATRPPSVTVADQTPSGGQVVTIDRVSAPNGGFVAVYARQPGADGRPAPLGTSTLLPQGTSRNVSVTLDEPLTEQRSVVVVVHRDDTDGQFEFVTADGTRDRPYRLNDRAVSAEAVLSSTDETTATDTPTDATPTDATPTDATPTDATPTDATPTTDGDGNGGLLDGVGAPGFGPVAALVAVLAVAVLVRRRG